MVQPFLVMEKIALILDDLRNQAVDALLDIPDVEIPEIMINDKIDSFYGRYGFSPFSARLKLGTVCGIHWQNHGIFEKRAVPMRNAP